LIADFKFLSTPTAPLLRKKSIEWVKKRGHRLMAIILSNLNRLKKSTRRFLSKFAVKRILKIPPHLEYAATLPCETLMSAKQAINDKLHGNFRCGGVVKTLRKAY